MRQNLTGSAAPQADPAAHGRAVEAQALRDLQAALPTGWTLETSIILARGGDADALLITGNGERFALDVKARTDEMDLSAPKGDRAKSWAEIYEQVTLAARQLQAQGVVWQPRTKDTAFTPVGALAT